MQQVTWKDKIQLTEPVQVAMLKVEPDIKNNFCSIMPPTRSKRQILLTQPKPYLALAQLDLDQRFNHWSNFGVGYLWWWNPGMCAPGKHNCCAVGLAGNGVQRHGSLLGGSSAGYKYSTQKRPPNIAGILKYCRGVKKHLCRIPFGLFSQCKSYCMNVEFENHFELTLMYRRQWDLLCWISANLKQYTL